jgi:hypothetical protein
MGNLTITAANVAAGANAKKKTGIAGATITAGMVLYEDSAASFVLKGAASGAVNTSNVVGIALNGGGIGQPITYVVEDDDFTVGATVVIGTTYVLSATAGLIALDSDIVAGYKAVLFVPKSTTKAVLKIVRVAVAI